VCLFDYFIDDSSEKIENGRLHKELMILLTRIIFFDVSVPFFVVVISPKDQFFIFFELDEGNTTDMKIVSITIPQPFSSIDDVIFK
jgi:hypothetical protein